MERNLWHFLDDGAANEFRIGDDLAHFEKLMIRLDAERKDTGADFGNFENGVHA